MVATVWGLVIVRGVKWYGVGLGAYVRASLFGRRRGSRLPIGACGLAFACLSDAPAARALDPIVFTQVPVAATREAGTSTENLPLVPELFPGTRIARFDPADPGKGATSLTSSFAAAGRPDVSFDGKRILFVGRRSAGDPLSLWQMNGDGGEPEPIALSSGHAAGDASDRSVARLLAGQADVSQAIYLSTIYTIDATEPLYQIGFHSRADGTRAGALFTCRMDGTRLRRITFEPLGVDGLVQLSDGRLITSRLLGANAEGTDLMMVHTDGADWFPFAGVHGPPAVRSMPCETPDGWVVYVESAAGSGDAGGSLAAVRRTRSLRTRRVVAAGADGLFRDPWALSDGSLLVSYRAMDPVTGRSPDSARASYGLYRLDESSGVPPTAVYDDPDWHELDAHVLGPRRIPDGRSSVVDDRADYGHLYCLDVYQTDREEGKTIRPGQIRRVRVYRALMPPDAEDGAPAAPDHPRETLLGEVPIEKDGSFFLELPARAPVRLETVDELGQVLQSMQSWVWVMPKGRRGCIGCHEDREMTPPNRHVLGLRQRPHRIGLPYIPHDPFRGRPMRKSRGPR
jgi:hypothetical protein